jgi:hypothetical protein
MSSVLRRRRLALALATAVTFGLPATAGAMPAGPDPPAPAGQASGAPPSRTAPIPPGQGDDVTLAVVLVTGGLLAAAAGGVAAYVGRHPRAVRLG